MLRRAWCIQEFIVLVSNEQTMQASTLSAVAKQCRPSLVMKTEVLEAVLQSSTSVACRCDISNVEKFVCHLHLVGE